MAYNNLQETTTYIQSIWDSSNSTSGISYSDLELEGGIPHKDQLEVERIFTLPTSPTNIRDNIDIYDLHKIFVLLPSEYTVDEVTKKITGFTISGTRNYAFQRGTLVGQILTIPPITLNEVIKIRRKTYLASSYITWTAGTRLTSSQLNLQVNQLLKILQELNNKLDEEYLKITDVISSNAPVFGINNELNMNGNKISSLANPSTVYNTDTQYAVNKGFIESHYVNKDQSITETITGNKTFTGTLRFNNTITHNVGIGASPSLSERLTVKNSSSDAVLISRFENGENAAYISLAVGGSSSSTIPSWKNSVILRGVPASTDGNMIISASANSLVFQLGWTEQMRITSEGNVGIGTNNPSTKLDVNGAIKASGSVTASSIDVTGAVNATAFTGTLASLASTLLPSKTILQVVTNSTSTAVNFSGNAVDAWVDSGLTITITPQRSNSKIILFAYGSGVYAATSSTSTIPATIRGQLTRSINNGTPTIVTGSYKEHWPLIYSGTTGPALSSPQIILCTDSPNTTSAIEYKLQVARGNLSTTSAVIQLNSSTSVILAIEVAN